MSRYPWMSYAQVRAYEAEAARLGVSEVARRPKGFLRQPRPIFRYFTLSDFAESGREATGGCFGAFSMQTHLFLSSCET